ncbi:hypothetical protein QOT17_009243 [Balamuthia mandrillaris]
MKASLFAAAALLVLVVVAAVGPFGAAAVPLPQEEQRVPAVPPSSHDLNNPKALVANQQVCSLCKIFVGYVDNMLQEQSTIDAIVHELENICAALPAPYNAECNSFIEQFVPEIINYIVEFGDPSTICGDLGLCQDTAYLLKLIRTIHAAQTQIQTQENNNGLQLQNKGDFDLKCEICELIASLVESWLKKGSTQDDIAAIIQQLCGILPSPYSDECSDMADQWVKYIIDSIVNAEPADKICHQVGICGEQRVRPTVYPVSQLRPAQQAQPQPLQQQQQQQRPVFNKDSVLVHQRNPSRGGLRKQL